MKCLAIDTTSSRLVVVLINEQKNDISVVEIGKSGHSQEIMPTIDNLLAQNKVDISEIDTFATIVGPGSFTGIRIGVACMTALSFANKAKRISINAFELYKYAYSNQSIAIDAGHGNLYCAKISNGIIEDMYFVEEKDNDGSIEIVSNPDYSSYYKIIAEKVSNNEYTKVFEPYYMRKSQAEREKDEI